MNTFKINFKNENFVYKNSGKLPEEFIPYIFVYRDCNASYDYQVGFYEPEYDNGNGGVFDGCGGHLEWNCVVAWKSLFDIKLAINSKEVD